SFRSSVTETKAIPNKKETKTVAQPKIHCPFNFHFKKERSIKTKIEIARIEKSKTNEVHSPTSIPKIRGKTKRMKGMGRK
ncbi:MAG: hypothetical protein ACPG5P_04145, partial [Saprospiraceae bacterium]